MKNTLLKLIVAIGAMALAPQLTAEPLDNPDPIKSDFSRISSSRERILNTLEMELRSTYSILTKGTDAEIKARLLLFGNRAAQTLIEYANTRELVLTARRTANIPALNDKVFVPQADGSVQYVAPPVPASEP
jgi:hypothetical protein